VCPLPFGLLFFFFFALLCVVVFLGILARVSASFSHHCNVIVFLCDFLGCFCRGLLFQLHFFPIRMDVYRCVWVVTCPSLTSPFHASFLFSSNPFSLFVPTLFRTAHLLWWWCVRQCRVSNRMPLYVTLTACKDVLVCRSRLELWRDVWNP
jgi:hypothetical protein